MATEEIGTEVDAPAAHAGAHYDNPETKRLLGPIPAIDRGSVQRVVWGVFFFVLFAALALALALNVSSAR